MENPFKKVFGKKEEKSEEKEKYIKLERISNFFNKKITESRYSAFDTNKANNLVSKEYAKGFTDIVLGEALRELGVGQKSNLLKILNTMVEKATVIDSNSPDIKEMQELIRDIEGIDIKISDTDKLYGGLYEQFPDARKNG